MVVGKRLLGSMRHVLIRLFSRSLFENERNWISNTVEILVMRHRRKRLTKHTHMLKEMVTSVPE